MKYMNIEKTESVKDIKYVSDIFSTPANIFVKEIMNYIFQNIEIPLLIIRLSNDYYLP